MADNVAGKADMPHASFSRAAFSFQESTMVNRMGDSAVAIGFDVGDRRAAVLRAEQERVEERRTKIDALTSPFAAPEERIRLWEDLHGVRLPRNADHSLVRVIAHRTALTVQQVHDEQRRRVDGTTHGAGSAL